MERADFTSLLEITRCLYSHFHRIVAFPEQGVTEPRRRKAFFQCLFADILIRLLEALTSTSLLWFPERSQNGWAKDTQRSIDESWGWIAGCKCKKLPQNTTKLQVGNELKERRLAPCRTCMKFLDPARVISNAFVTQ